MINNSIQLIRLSKDVFKASVESGEGRFKALQKAAMVFFGRKVDRISCYGNSIPKPSSQAFNLPRSGQSLLSKKITSAFTRSSVNERAYLNKVVEIDKKSGEIVPVHRSFFNRSSSLNEVNRSLRDSLNQRYGNKAVDAAFTAIFGDQYASETTHITDLDIVALLSFLQTSSAKTTSISGEDVDYESTKLIFRYDNATQTMQIVPNEELADFLMAHLEITGKKEPAEKSREKSHYRQDIKHKLLNSAELQGASFRSFKKAITDQLIARGASAYSANDLFNDTCKVLFGSVNGPKPFTGKSALQFLSSAGAEPMLGLAELRLEPFLPGGEKFAILHKKVTEVITEDDLSSRLREKEGHPSAVEVPELPESAYPEFANRCQQALKEKFYQKWQEAIVRNEKNQKAGKKTSQFLQSDVAIGREITNSDIQKIIINEYIKMIQPEYSEALLKAMEQRQSSI